jgi:hypothetical protein
MNRTPTSPPTSWRQALEITLFSISLALLIPPVPSDQITRYSLFPGDILPIALFAASRALLVWRRCESLWSAIVQVIVFAIFGMLISDRAQIS